MRLLLRLLLVLVAFLMGWLGSGTPLALGDSTSPPVANAYDSQNHSTVVSRAFTERGPPGKYDHTDAYDAVRSLKVRPDRDPKLMRRPFHRSCGVTLPQTRDAERLTFIRGSRAN